MFFPPTPPPSQGPVSFALTTFTKLSVLSNIHFLQLSPFLQGAILNFHCNWVFMEKGVFFGWNSGKKHIHIFSNAAICDNFFKHKISKGFRLSLKNAYGRSLFDRVVLVLIMSYTLTCWMNVSTSTKAESFSFIIVLHIDTVIKAAMRAHILLSQ